MAKETDNPKPEHDDNANKTAEQADAEFDKERQRADQAEANFRKAQAEKARLASEVEQLRQQHSNTQRQIDELTAGQAAESDVTSAIPDINADEASLEDIGKALSAAKNVIAGQAKELASLKASQAAIEADRTKSQAQRDAESQRNATLDKVCRKLEAKYGPGLRNKAIDRMETRIETEGEPASPAEAVLMLDECFAEVKASTKKTKAEAPITDPGGGGGGRPSLGDVQIQPGSLDEVAAQMKRALTATPT